MAAVARTKMKGRKIAVVDLDAEDVPPVEKDDETKGMPFFEGLGEEVKIEVYRQEPIEEGTIGTLPPDADESTIRRRWGGGVYLVKARGTNGRFERRQRTVTIGGDPKFESEDATRRYRIKIGKLPDDNAKPAAPAAAAGLDLIGILQASHQQSMQFMQAQLGVAQQMADHRAAAASKASEEARQRDREFFQSMLALNKRDEKAETTDPMAMISVLLKGLQLGRDMGSGGGGEADPVAAFIGNLPVMLPQIQAMLSGQVAAPAAPANQQAPQPPGPKVTLSGPIAAQFSSTVRQLAEKGYNPEAALAAALQQLSGLPVAPREEPAPAAAAAGGGAAPAAPGGKGTSPPSRATSKK